MDLEVITLSEITQYCMIPLTKCIENSQIHKIKDCNGGDQGLRKEERRSY